MRYIISQIKYTMYLMEYDFYTPQSKVELRDKRGAFEFEFRDFQCIIFRSELTEGLQRRFAPSR